MYSSIALSAFTLCTAITTRHLQNIFIFPHWISTSIKHQFPTLLPSNFWHFLSLWIWLFYMFHISGILQHLTFCHWFISPSRTFSEFIYDEACVLMLCLFCCCSVTQSCLTLCNPMDCSTPGFSVRHHLPNFTQTHVHWVGGAIQPS